MRSPTKNVGTPNAPARKRLLRRCGESFGDAIGREFRSIFAPVQSVMRGEFDEQPGIERPPGGSPDRVCNRQQKARAAAEVLSGHRTPHEQLEVEVELARFPERHAIERRPRFCIDLAILPLVLTGDRRSRKRIVTTQLADIGPVNRSPAYGAPGIALELSDLSCGEVGIPTRRCKEEIDLLRHFEPS